MYMRDEDRCPAGLWIRLLAFGLDYVPIAAYLGLVVGAGAGLNRLAPHVVHGLFGNPARAELTGFALITLPVALYFALSEASASQGTWGKRVLGLKVVDGLGRRLGLFRSLGRSALKFVPWELAHAWIWQITFARDPSSARYTLGLVVVWVLVALNAASVVVSRDRRALYDRAAGTLVERAARRTAAARPCGSSAAASR